MKESYSQIASTSPLQQEVRLTDYIGKQVRENTELLGIVITDRDGVPIIQDWSSEAKDLRSRFAQSSQIAASFSNMSEQANKLGIGASDLFVASYSHYQVLQFNELQTHNCLVTLFVKTDSNIGTFIDQRETWKHVAELINTQVIRNTRHAPTLI